MDDGNSRLRGVVKDGAGPHPRRESAISLGGTPPFKITSASFRAAAEVISARSFASMRTSNPFDSILPSAVTNSRTVL